MIYSTHVPRHHRFREVYSKMLRMETEADAITNGVNVLHNDLNKYSLGEKGLSSCMPRPCALLPPPLYKLLSLPQLPCSTFDPSCQVLCPSLCPRLLAAPPVAISEYQQLTNCTKQAINYINGWYPS